MATQVLTQVITRDSAELFPPTKLPPISPDPVIPRDSPSLDSDDVSLSESLQKAERNLLPPICWEDAAWRDPQELRFG